MLRNDFKYSTILAKPWQGVMHTAKTIAYACLAACLCFFLAACGVKTVGDGVAPHTPSGLEKAAYDPVDARYPAFGTRNEKRLYTLNHPRYFRAQQDYVQASIRSQYTTGTRGSGNKIFITDNEAEKVIDFQNNIQEQPKHLSPFR